MKMKSFYDYLSEREEDPLGDIGAPSHDSESVLTHIATMAIADHRSDVLNLFSQLAKKDGRIEDALKDYERSRKHGFHIKKDGNVNDRDDDDRDEVMPSSADKQGDLDGDEF